MTKEEVIQRTLGYLHNRCDKKIKLATLAGYQGKTDLMKEYAQEAEAYSDLIRLISPVMQEGKEEFGEGLTSCPFCGGSMLETYRCCINCFNNNFKSVDDEQPEHRGMPLFPTPYSDTDIHPRSHLLTTPVHIQ